jgi:hypothetical protein
MEFYASVRVTLPNEGQSRDKKKEEKKRAASTTREWQKERRRRTLPREKKG